MCLSIALLILSILLIVYITYKTKLLKQPVTYTDIKLGNNSKDELGCWEISRSRGLVVPLIE